MSRERALAYPITDLLSELGISIHHEGVEQQIRCPVHSDSVASARYYPESNSIYCFTCAESYNPIDLAMLCWELSFVEAIEKLGGRDDDPASRFFRSYAKFSHMSQTQALTRMFLIQSQWLGQDVPDDVWHKFDRILVQYEDLSAEEIVEKAEEISL